MAEGQSWTVTAQREDFRADAQGEYTHGVMVSFQTGQGNRGSVFIPQADYRAEVVRQRVGEKAAAMDAIGNLTGG